jgi:hypothetical protein
MIGMSKERWTDIHERKFFLLELFVWGESSRVYSLDKAVSSNSRICTIFVWFRQRVDEGLVVAHLISRLEM